MAAAQHNILIEQGATFTLDLVWQDADENPIDITGYTARMQVRRKHADSAILLNFTTENGAITLGDAAGTIAVSALASITDGTLRTAVYDLELESAVGVVTRLVEGRVTITPEVTR